MIVDEWDSLYNTFHFGDDVVESTYLTDIIINRSNIKHLKLRKKKVDASFYSKLEHLDAFMTQQKKSRTDLCIVWSWSLWVYWLDKVSDIDVIYPVVENKGIITQNGIDILDYRYYNTMSNQELIYDDGNTFYYRWLKFISLELLLKIKWLQGSRAKDITQSQKIQNFLAAETDDVYFNNFAFQFHLFKNRIRVYIIMMWISLTQKIGIYAFVSRLWRKYVLKNNM
jgi:hypothetical protein